MVRSESLNYETYIAELGKNILGTNRRISTQPYIGSLFKSQNASTWTAFQLEDLMFRINRCVFSAQGAVHFNNVPPVSNTSLDWWNLNTNDLIFSNTAISYSYQARRAYDQNFDSGFTRVIENSNYRFDTRKILLTDVASMNVRADLVASSDAISPVIDLNRTAFISIENRINNANVTNNAIIMTNYGTGYSNAANISITITGGTIPANAYVGAVANGSISSIIVDQGGTLLLDNASIIFSGGGGTGASATIATETSPTGGTGLARYITRKVQLIDTYLAGDLRVYLTSYRPLNSEIAVYYKVLSSDDPDTFASKNYNRMVLNTSSDRFSKNENDLIEYEYRPSLSSNTIAYTSNTASFDSFSTFAIKVVLLSDDTINVPFVKDLRAIALPGTD